MMNEPEEVICPACTECSMFTVIVIGDGSWAKCENCGHLIEVTLVGRFATANAAGEVAAPSWPGREREWAVERAEDYPTGDRSALDGELGHRDGAGK